MLRYDFLMEVFTSRYTYFFLMGVGVLFGVAFAYQDHAEQTIRNTYKTTTCTVTDSGVAVEEHLHRGGGRFGRFRTYSTYTFYPDVTYTYVVNGQEYENDVYRYHEQGMSEQEADKIANQYPEGRNAKCYYNPDDPEDSVLTLESDTRGMYTMGAVGVFFLLIGLGGWVMIDYILPGAENKPRRARRPEPEPEIPGLQWLSEPAVKEVKS
jgi:hypothetical protein